MDKLYFRVDMNATVATGHMMRCLSIADGAQKLGVDCIFLLADNQALTLVNERGHQAVVLNTQWDKLDDEIDIICEFITKEDVRHLIVDSYYVTEKYLEEVSRLTEVTYIDDLNAIEHKVNNIICYANYYKKFDYDKNVCLQKRLLGCSYIPLRQEFYGLKAKKINDRINNVLLLSGGADQYHILSKLVDRLNAEFDFNLTVVCGKYNTDYDDMANRYSESKKVSIYKQLPTLFEAMQEADVTVSAGGTTLYELCACGTPAITYSFVDNQLDNVKQFKADGIMEYAGDIRYDEVVDNVVDILQLYRSTELRAELSAKMQKLIDGKGAERIVKDVLEI